MSALWSRRKSRAHSCKQSAETEGVNLMAAEAYMEPFDPSSLLTRTSAGSKSGKKKVHLLIRGEQVIDNNPENIHIRVASSYTSAW